MKLGVKAPISGIKTLKMQRLSLARPLTAFKLYDIHLIHNIYSMLREWQDLKPGFSYDWREAGSYFTIVHREG
jgi:hypothetical protein